MATKLFVGNLAFTATTAEIEALFGQVGAVDSATIIMDRFSGQSRGFGFVEMHNDQEAETAVERFHGHQLGGHPLTVNKTKPQGERSGGGDRERRW
jgi:RNA recognition motif-containing protein